ncbi:hypothetical protein I7I50_03826 [Histoplasma capsulatum G186AR]|uniref:Uncharacterized protein n=1 Tax=Ajellomyces capsulatus TaxID=5037 RepID=A0A8H7YPK0_AJECA|nr:hypothetical protein I7I52_04734 [Histoplasma capsulatum]QSS74880.1 hypothetical protein I7I50_03826 [Histoplasma capsulatum G186AR]
MRNDTLYTSSRTSLKPASIKCCFCSRATFMRFPNFILASSIRASQRAVLGHFLSVGSSSEETHASYSCISIQPPGFRCWSARLYSMFQSFMLPPIPRAWIKSNASFGVYTHSLSTSST